MKKKNKLFGTVTFRLAVWYAAIFAVFSLIAFGFIYVHLKINLKKQIDIALQNELDEIEKYYTVYGLEGLRSELNREAESEGVQNICYRYFSDRIELLASSDLSNWGQLELGENVYSGLVPGSVDMRTIALPGKNINMRMATLKTNSHGIFQIGMTLNNYEHFLKNYLQTSGIISVIMLMIGSVTGWFISRKAMSGVIRITKTAEIITGGDLRVRVALGSEGEEIHNLTTSFNMMLEKIQTLITEITEVTNNIAHDLRSPMTRIRGVCETTLTGEQDIDVYQKMTQTVIAESDTLIGMVNTMLDIAQTGAGILELAHDVINMGKIITDAGELFLPVAEEKGIHLFYRIPDEPLNVVGDRSRLQRMVANVLDNAIKYTDKGGHVTLSGKTQGERVFIEIADTGHGITEKDLPYIFKRFFRSDKSRSSIGNGLGLSLAQAIASAHQGTITVQSTFGKGSVFTISLPKIGGSS